MPAGFPYIQIYPPAGLLQGQLDPVCTAAGFYLTQHLRKRLSMSDKFRQTRISKGTGVSKQKYGFKKVGLTLAIQPVQQIEMASRLNPAALHVSQIRH